MNPRRVALCALLLAAAGLAWVPAARGHGRSTSTSSWDFAPGPLASARVQVRVRWSDLQRALPVLAGATQEAVAARPDLAAAVDDYLFEHVALWAGGERCPLAGTVHGVPTPDPTDAGRAWRMRCRRPGPPVLRIDAFFEGAPAHLHLARARLPGGDVLERVFVLDATSFSLPIADGEAASAGASGFLDYLRLGVEHIASGADHLVFLLALLLLGGSLLEVATIVTGFTVAHSVTLALGVLGVVQPLSAAVESLIGLSIVVVALENFAATTGAPTRRAILVSLALGLGLAAAGAGLGAVAVPASALLGIGLFSVAYLALTARTPRPGRLRWCVAFCFGLIHGFGFAGVLVSVGLPTDRLAPALLGFNLGVEVGQLAIVAAVWPVLWWGLGRVGAARPLWIQLGSTPILVLGLYWFLSRAVA